MVYHKIDPRPELGITCIHPKQFEKQIRFLADQGYQFLTLEKLVASKSVNPKAIAITFDDGYRDIHKYALPILKKYNAPATVFIITDYIGKENTWDVNLGWIRYEHLNEREIDSLIDEGWEINSHGTSHCSLHGLTEREIIRELSRSKTMLQERFRQPIRFFAIPFGNINERIRRLAIKTGYQGIAGFYPVKYFKNPLPLGIILRLAVYRTDSLKSIKRKLSNNSELLKEVLKQNAINLCSNATIIVNSLR